MKPSPTLLALIRELHGHYPGYVDEQRVRDATSALRSFRVSDEDGVRLSERWFKYGPRRRPSTPELLDLVRKIRDEDRQRAEEQEQRRPARRYQPTDEQRVQVYLNALQENIDAGQLAAARNTLKTIERLRGRGWVFPPLPPIPEGPVPPRGNLSEEYEEPIL